jgi:uncharacterized protein
MNLRQWAQSPVLNRIDDASWARLEALLEDGLPLHYVLRFRYRELEPLDDFQIRLAFRAQRAYQSFLSRRDAIVAQAKELEVWDADLETEIARAQGERELDLVSKTLKRRKKQKGAKPRDPRVEELGLLVWKAAHTDPQSGLRNEGDLAAAEAALGPAEPELRSQLGAWLHDKMGESLPLRQRLFDALMRDGVLIAERSEKAQDSSRFKPLFNFKERISRLDAREMSYRYLTLRRGASQGDLMLRFEGDFRPFEKECDALLGPSLDTLPEGLRAYLQETARTYFQKHVLASVTKELHSVIKSVADTEALGAVRDNFRRVLSTPPFGRQPVMGVCSSGKKTCRVAVVDRDGVPQDNVLVHLLEGPKKQETDAVFLALIEKHKVAAVAIGSQQGAREIERALHDIFREVKLRLPIVLLPNEGSDAYADSDVAEKELPGIDPAARKAVFLARQLQDPLAELIKVKAKSLGVGQFLNEIDVERLLEALLEVTQDLIHEVGTDLNASSAYLLSLVSGLNEELAAKIVAHREAKGFFWDLEQLRDVEGVDERVFEHAASFLKIRDGKNPLDERPVVHPKHHARIFEAAQRLRMDKAELATRADELIKDEKLAATVPAELLGRALASLKSPPADLRGEFRYVQFREDVKDLRDLKMGMICPGRVSNVTPFGAFVDIGLQQDGLVHLSEMSNRYVRDPFEVLQPGDLVTVKVLSVDPDKKQISLSMKGMVEEASERNQDILKRRPAEAPRSEEPREERPRREDRPHGNRPQGDRPRGDGARREAQPQSGQRNDSRGGPRRDGPHRDGPRRDGPRRDGPRRDDRESGGGFAKPSSGKELKDNPFAALAALMKDK